jgi:penicillin V acylase-like amidase (Ntn superfamily)
MSSGDKMCTRVFWSDNSVAKVVSRTMDWAVSDDPVLWAVPEGTRRAAGGGVWESRFGVVGLSMWDSGTTDAVNTAGLAAHLLYLGAAGFAAPGTPGAISNLLWAQWTLDRFATVAEAVAALSDRPVVANDPPFDDQLENLSRYRPFGGSRPLPGGIESADRFVRAAYFLHYLPEPANLAEAVAGAVNVAGTVSVPPGAPYDDFGVYPTWWTSAIDLTNLTYYFWSHASPSMMWVELSGIDMRPGSPVRSLNPRGLGLVGDVTARLTPAALTY